MFNISKLSRRDILKTGGIGGAAVLANSGTSLLASFSAEGATAPINVISTNSTLTNSVLNLLQSQKYTDQFGISMDLLRVVDATMVNPAIIGGQSDISFLNGIGLALATIAKGAPMKVIGSNCLLVPNAVYSANPKVKVMKDLEGKTVGTGAIGALTYQLMVALMQKKGVDVSKVTFHNVGSSTDIFRAVSAGIVDAGPSVIDVYNEQAKYGVHSLTDGNFWTELSEYTYQGGYASDHAIATKRDGLIRVMAAFSKTFQYIQSPGSREDFIKARLAAGGKNNDKEAVDTWNFFRKYQPYAPDFRLSEKRVTYMQNLNHQFSMQKTIVPYAKLVDMSLAHEAVKMAGT